MGGWTLVVPTKFSARTKCSRTARVLDEQLSSLNIEKKGLHRKFPIYVL